MLPRDPEGEETRRETRLQNCVMQDRRAAATEWWSFIQQDHLHVSRIGTQGNAEKPLGAVKLFGPVQEALPPYLLFSR